MFDFDVDLDELDAEEIEELEKGIRSTCKLTIRALEIFYEELQNSKLPEEIKTAEILVLNKEEAQMLTKISVRPDTKEIFYSNDW